MTIKVLIYATLIISLLGMINTPNVFLLLTTVFTLLTLYCLHKKEILFKIKLIKQMFNNC